MVLIKVNSLRVKSRSASKAITVLQFVAFLSVACLANAERDYEGQPIGYSYAKFSGPVSGPSKEVHTHDEHHGHSVDYVSKPDYQFEYGVEDPKSQVSQFRKENRQDDAVVGEYSYTDPLGHVRLVKYTADKLHGFRAEIYVDGKLETPHSSSNHQDHQHEAHHEVPQVTEEEAGDYTSSEDY